MITNSELPLVVVVDDESEILAAIKRSLMRVDVCVETFNSPRLAIEFITNNEPIVVISDQRMPDITGQEVLTKVKDIWPNCRRIMLSAYRDFDEIADGFNQAVIEKFIAKPWKNAELIFIVEDAINQTKETAKPERQFNEIVGQCPPMQTLFSDISNAAGANVPIFIHGETGTGKELVARACHQYSHRADNEFIAVNCANFSETLIESQLFGHKKGAFTGATSDQAGILKQCQGGTLFLDEVTTLPMPLQAKLLRVLQEREFTPIGETKTYSFDAQIVSASSVRLVDAVRQGEFRQDLYYRLNVIPLQIPALRERGHDILLIAQKYLAQYSQEQNKSFADFDDNAKQFLLNYPWPGNVRQLENLIHSVVIMNQGQYINVDMLSRLVEQEMLDELPAQTQTPSVSVIPEPVSAPNGAINSDTSGEVKPLAEIEKQAILAAIESCQGNISQAAALLDVNPSTIYRKMQKW